MKALPRATEGIFLQLISFRTWRSPYLSLCCPCVQVMETERMIYLVTEYASGGEIFGEYIYCLL